MPGELILIIEDNEKNMKLLRDLLQHEGYRTLETDTAEKGLLFAGEHLPALILMDVGLPGMNGYDALRCLRANTVTSDIPVIAVTASVMTQDQEKIMAAGFDGCQKKPIDIDEFLEAVHAMIGNAGGKGRRG